MSDDAKMIWGAIGIGMLVAYLIAVAGLGDVQGETGDQPLRHHLEIWHFFVSIPIALVAGPVVGLIGLGLLFVGVWLWAHAMRILEVLLGWFGLLALGIWLMAALIRRDLYLVMVAVGVAGLVGGAFLAAKARRDESRVLAFNTLVAGALSLAMIVTGLTLAIL